MPEQERKVLLKIHEAIKKMNEPPPPTMSPYTGEAEKEDEYKAPTYSGLTLPPSQAKR